MVILLLNTLSFYCLSLKLFRLLYDAFGFINLKELVVELNDEFIALRSPLDLETI